MKKITILTACILVCNCLLAKIWRVNNVAGVVANFTAIQAANDNASVLNGDTIHIEPSVTNYGGLTLTKRLTLISIGNFLSVNPGLQHSAVPGTINGLTINSGAATGAVFHCNFAGSVSVTNASNLRFERCRFQSTFTISNGGSSMLMNSYFGGFVTVTNSNDVVVANNIFSSILEVSPSASATVTNNVLNAVTSGTPSRIENSIVQNNIINKPQAYTFANSTVSNNLTSGTTLPAGNNNMNNVSMATVFVNPNGTDDVSFVLQTTGSNPAVDAGVGGVDAGAYGGSSPFKPGLQAAVPAIYKLSAPLSPGGSTMNVTFSTRSNN